jgi:hypothetical protein
MSIVELGAGLALLGLVLGFGEGDLIHGGNESYAVNDDCIIADFGGLFRVFLNKKARSKSGLFVSRRIKMLWMPRWASTVY